MKRSFILAAVVGLAASCSMALAQDKPAGGKPAAEPAGQPEKKGSPKLEAGAAAPALQVEKWLKGSPVAGFEKGKVYIVEFWATWCGPCMRSIPHLTELQKEFKDKGVTIIGVTSKDRRGNTLEKAEKMVEDKGATMDYTVAWDVDRKTTEAYLDAAEAPGIPWAFVIDKDGKIAFIGNPLEFDLGTVLDRMFDGKWDIKKGPEELESMSEESAQAFKAMIERSQKDAPGAWKDWQDYEKKFGRMAKALPQLALKAELMLRNNDPDAGKLAGPTVEKLIAARDAINLNGIAWAIVDPKGGAKSKDLDLALKASTEADRLTKSKNAAIIDTLARVYWLKNDKIKAVELQRKAVDLAGDDEELLKELQDNLKEYQSTGKS